MRYFGCFEGIFDKLKVSRVFRSFYRFRGNFSNFLGFGVILVKFLDSKGILVIFFRLWGHFCHFLGFKGILVIFRFWVILVILGFEGISVIF